jgi:hypothetical protein
MELGKEERDRKALHLIPLVPLLAVDCLSPLLRLRMQSVTKEGGRHGHDRALEARREP